MMVSCHFPHGPYVGLTMYPEDQTNLHRLARHNAQEAIALAKQRAQDFDAQAALERKTNEALRLAKAQAHLRSAEEHIEGAPLLDRTRYPLLLLLSDATHNNFSGLGGTELPEPEFTQRPSDGWPAPHVDGSTEGVPTERVELVGHAVRARNQRYPRR